MIITDKDRIAAEKRMQDDHKNQPKAVRARYDRRMSRIIVSLDSGLDLAFPPRLAQGLENATADELSNIEISPFGDGLHWPAIDADLYVPALERFRLSLNLEDSRIGFVMIQDAGWTEAGILWHDLYRTTFASVLSPL